MVEVVYDASHASIGLCIAMAFIGSATKIYVHVMIFCFKTGSGFLFVVCTVKCALPAVARWLRMIHICECQAQRH